MDTTIFSSHAATASRRGIDVQTARAIGVTALSLGLVAQSLFYGGAGGLGVAIWIALLVLNLVNLVWRDGRTVPRESVAWLLAAVLFSSATAWRNSGPLGALDILATLLCLGMAAARLRDPAAGIYAERLPETVRAGVRLAQDIAAGILPIAFREIWILGEATQMRGAARPVLRAALFGFVIVIVFGSLLRGADPIFASFITLPSFDVQDLVGRCVITGFFAWLVAGWARGALLPSPERAADAPFRFSLGALDVTTILGTLDALFTLFVVAQLGWIFGGESFLRERTGLTAAAYARQGFFQMLWIVALVVPVLVLTRVGVRDDAALRRRHTILSVPAILLLGAMILSAVLRMKMYVHYFGLTPERLFPLVFMGWLAFVLVWTAATVLRDRGRPFAAGATISALFVLAGLNVADPDAIVARVNVDRATRVGQSPATVPLDVAHLAALGDGAVAVATSVVVQQPAYAADASQRCAAAKLLLKRWGPLSRQAELSESAAAWRYWNAGDAAARRIVGGQAGALMQVVRSTCTNGSKASGPPA